MNKLLVILKYCITDGLKDKTCMLKNHRAALHPIQNFIFIRVNIFHLWCQGLWYNVFLLPLSLTFRKLLFSGSYDGRCGQSFRYIWSGKLKFKERLLIRMIASIRSYLKFESRVIKGEGEVLPLRRNPWLLGLLLPLDQW